ncbi:MAG: hypothetical protein QOH06_5648 [Acidobacteriota bacterium]|jgi:hypothetical protein|nr:hypothetical protein [Acidobacteriota bacterium]
MADHDKGYKLLFSHAAMVADLLQGFVKEDWVREVDLETLTKVDGSYVSDDLRSRENDVVWRVGWKESWLYVYLLLEFQSAVDPFMAVRVMTYLGLLYQDLIRQKLLTPSGRLPPVFLLVLYNGARPWRAALDMADLVEPVPGGLESYRPQLRYALIDESRIPKMELEAERNLAAALFRLETSRGAEDVGRGMAEMAACLTGSSDESLRRSVETWLKRVLLPTRFPGLHVPEVADLQEIQAMLAERALEWTREWKEEGRQEGVQSLQQVVLSQLEQRFGTISEEVRQSIENLRDLDSLTRLAKRILLVSSIGDLGLG